MIVFRLLYIRIRGGIKYSKVNCDYKSKLQTCKSGYI